MQVLKETGRILYVDEDVAKSAPQHTGNLEFFTVDRYITEDELEKEYETRKLKPASILSLCEYDKTNRNDLDEKGYVGTHWKDAKGEWCCAVFDRRGDERGVYVNRRDYGWYRYYRFAGVRKSSDLKSSEFLDPLSLRVKKLENQVEKLTNWAKKLAPPEL